MIILAIAILVLSFCLMMLCATDHVRSVVAATVLIGATLWALNYTLNYFNLIK